MIKVTLAVMAGVFLALLAVNTGWCAAPETPKIGVLDMDHVATDYRAMQEMNQQFQDFQREQEQQLRERHKTRMLTDEERQEFSDLSHLAAPTETREKRLKELEDLSNQREKRLLELRKQEQLTAEEETELKELNTRYDQRMSELATLQSQLQESRVAKYEELTKIITENVDNAVKKVAEEQKLTIVMRKESVMYGGIDITEAVLEKLNAKPTA